MIFYQTMSVCPAKKQYRSYREVVYAVLMGILYNDSELDQENGIVIILGWKFILKYINQIKCLKYILKNLKRLKQYNMFDCYICTKRVFLMCF